MQTLLERSEAEPHAAQAVKMFCYHARKQIGAFMTVLGGLDMLVFTGGIGEHAAPLRWEICRGLEYLGISWIAGKTMPALVRSVRVIAAPWFASCKPTKI